jgi:hypothetical protein
MALDKNILASISNFATALEQLVEELKTQDKAKAEQQGFFSSLFGKTGTAKTMKRVEEGIKSIKKDTTEIIKNQKELLKLNKVKKKEDNKNAIGDAGDKSQLDKIKAGVGSIILIAGAVLAIGLAFNIVGSVDVVSILALSFSITLLGLTLAKLHETGVPSMKDSMMIGFSLLAFTTAVVASSWLMTLITPVSMFQLLTFGAILGAFSLLSFGMKTLISATKDMSPLQILTLPFVLVGISAAIVASSFVLQYVQTIPPKTLMGILMIGMALGGITLVMSIPLLIMSKMGKYAIVGAFLATILLPALSLAIVASSWILALVSPVSPAQLMNVLMIGLTMGIIAIVMSIPLLVMSKMGRSAVSGAFLAAIILPALALGIMLSSWMLNKVTHVPMDKLFNILMIGLTLGVLSLIMTMPLILMGKFAGAILKGALVSVIAFPLMTMGIMLSSWILSVGNYDKPIPLDWAISFGLAMLILAIPVVILGAISLPVVAMGAAGLILVAAAISASSWLLAYANPKGFEVMADAMAYFIKTVGPPIAEFVDTILPILAKGVGLLANAILPPLQSFINGVLPTLEKFLRSLLDGIFPIIQEVFDFLKEIIRSISGIIGSIGSAIAEASVIFPKIGEMFKLIGEGISKPLEAIEGVVRSVGDVIVNVITSVVNAVTTFSEMNPVKLESVGNALGVMGDAIKDLTGGAWDTLVTAFSGGKQDPITRILKSITENGDGVNEVADSLSRLPNIMKNLNNIDLKSHTLDGLINGVDQLNDIDIKKGNMDQVLNVLERLDNLKSVSGDIQTSNKNTIEIEGLKNITEPNNEELLEQLRIMNQQLYVISSTSGTISSQLNRLGNNDEDSSLSYNT